MLPGFIFGYLSLFFWKSKDEDQGDMIIEMYVRSIIFNLIFWPILLLFLISYGLKMLL
jgi:hypothetical protein